MYLMADSVSTLFEALLEQSKTPHGNENVSSSIHEAMKK